VEDVNLLFGIHKYGMGSWDYIKADPEADVCSVMHCPRQLSITVFETYVPVKMPNNFVPSELHEYETWSENYLRNVRTDIVTWLRPDTKSLRYCPEVFFLKGERA
jgi:hypothetical protein